MQMSNFKTILLLALIGVIPLLAIISAEFENLTGSNSLMLISVVIFSVVPVIVVCTKVVPDKFFPVVIFSVSLALVLHQALITSQLWGADINAEYYYFHETIRSQHWNSSVPSLYAATTSVTIFPTVLSLATCIDGMWIFKAIFPALYSVVPLVLYTAFRKQIGSKPAFLAAFFFAAVPSFYELDLSEGKQMIATLFLAMFILMLIKAPKRYSGVLLFLFGVGTIISHYSTGLFFVALLIVVTPILWLKHKSFQLPFALSVSLCSFYFVWYAWTTGGTVIDMFGYDFNAVYSALHLFQEPGSRYSLVILQANPNSVAQLITMANLLFEALIAFGIIHYLYLRIKKREASFQWRFAVFALASFAFLLLTVVLPLLGSYFNATRLHTLTLLFLSPFGVLGCIAFGRLLATIFRFKDNDFLWLKVLSVFAAVFLLLNVGFFSAVANEPYSSAFSVVPNTTYAIFNEKEFSNALWLTTYALPSASVFMDPASVPVFMRLRYLNDITEVGLSNVSNLMQPGNVFFVNTRNLQTDTVQHVDTIAETRIVTTYAVNLSEYYHTFIATSNRIYDNGYSCSLLFP